MKETIYFVYMLRCEDQSIYTGIATDLSKRMQEHFGKLPQCAKYTMRHNAEKLECAWQTENRSLASKLEWRIKHLSKKDKELLIQKRGEFKRQFEPYFEVNKFMRLSKQELKKYEKEACTFPKKAVQ